MVKSFIPALYGEMTVDTDDILKTATDVKKKYTISINNDSKISKYIL